MKVNSRTRGRYEKLLKNFNKLDLKRVCKKCMLKKRVLHNLEELLHFGRG